MTTVSSGYFHTQSYGSLYRADNSPALDPSSIRPAGGASSAALESVLDARTKQDSASAPSGAPPTATDSLMQTLQAHSAFTAQQLGQQQNQEPSDARAPGINAGDEEEAESPAEQAFMEYMAKSTGEKFFERFLAGKGMTQEDFDALSPEKQKALVQEFEEAMKRDLEQKTAEKLSKTQYAGLF